jgi:nucleotide-binding universal stress UspA family protein
MTKIIACIDGSDYTKNICNLSAWVANKTKLKILALHVAKPHLEIAAKIDLSGSIGLGAKSKLLQELTEIDEAHSKLEQKKSYIMLGQAKEEFKSRGINDPEILHHRGSLVDSLLEIESKAELIIIGKRGESANYAQNHLGSNLERVARAIHKPILVATKEIKEIKSFLIAYDGSASSKKAVNYITNNPLLRDLKCHLLTASANENKAERALGKAKKELQKSGFLVQTKVINNALVADAVGEYVNNNEIDLLVIGAYGHSKIRNLILGSTTTELITQSNISLLLFRI